MSNSLFFSLKLSSALGCGLVAGIFFAFSTFVMSALGRLQSAQGIAAMQAINITVINPWFMTVFLGTSTICLFLGISSLFEKQQPGAVYLFVGSLLYLVGTLLVTMLFNVPMNDALEAVTPNSAEAARLWSNYLASGPSGIMSEPLQHLRQQPPLPVRSKVNDTFYKMIIRHVRS